MFTKKTKLGFTLAELLAVVVIVGILTVVGAGYYRRSVEQARFSEGLMDASALAEGVNRAMIENQLNGTSCSTTSSKMNLGEQDIALSNSSPCGGTCSQTRNFEFNYNKSYYYVSATRRNGPYAGVYEIRANTLCASPRDEVRCVGKDAAGQGKTFCQSMGYTSCGTSTTATCRKP